MSAQSDADPSQAEESEEGGGLLPAIVVGAGILVVAALLIFDFGDSDTDADGSKDASSAQSANGAGAGAAGGRAAGGKGGVQSRPYDAAKGNGETRINPKIRLANVGMAPQAPTEPAAPPTFETTAEEIAWFEKKLVRARQARDARKKFVERLPKVKEKIEAGANTAAGLKTFEGRKKIVEDNYDKAVKKVEEIETKLAELRG